MHHLKTTSTFQRSQRRKGTVTKAERPLWSWFFSHQRAYFPSFKSRPCRKQTLIEEAHLDVLNNLVNWGQFRNMFSLWWQNLCIHNSATCYPSSAPFLKPNKASTSLQLLNSFNISQHPCLLKTTAVVYWLGCCLSALLYILSHFLSSHVTI